MDRLRDTTGIYMAAEHYARLGLPIIPLRGKVPAIRRWQEYFANAVNVRFWFGTKGCNIGLRTGESGYIVLDTDTPDAEQWVKTHCEESPMQVLTGRGARHHYYGRPPDEEIRNRQGLRGIDGLDVRGHGGYIVVPPSIHPDTGKAYAWMGDFLPPEGLPRFSPAWIYRQTRLCVQSVMVGEIDPEHLLDRGRLYVAKFDEAVSGHGGHTTTFKSALKIVRFVNFDPQLAWQLMLHYNATRCKPPWDEKALRHKLEDALRLASR